MKYYYPISSTSLATIFGQACILPAILYKNRLPDIQNKYENYLLLTNQFGCKESDCCLQIALTEEEENALIDVKEGFFLYENALPISRIVKIYFANAVQASRTISNITLSTAFIPNEIVDSNSNTFANNNTSAISIPEDLVSLTDIVKQSYEKYDRILGAMALMKVAHEERCNFSSHYIDLLSKFNTVVEEQKKKTSNIDTKFHKVVDTPPAFLTQTVDMATLEEEAKHNNQTINKNRTTKVIDPSNLDKTAYVCYVLYDYGVGEESHRHKIDELILDNFTGLKRGYEESCAFYYGYNRGYAAFNNQYKKEGKTEIVKYKLNSLLDYYTIESIFEYCFNKKTSSKIYIFDSWVKPLAQRKTKKGEYIILDTIVRDKKKATLFSEEWWKECLSFFLAKDSVLFLGYDFSSIITDKILRPFSELIKEELSDIYEEKIQIQHESDIKVIERLQNELQYYKDQVLKLEEENKALSVSCSPEAIKPDNEVQNTTNVDNIEFAKKVISLYTLSIPDLKRKAKSYGCKVNSNSKKEELVYRVLYAEQRKDNQLF